MVKKKNKNTFLDVLKKIHNSKFMVKLRKRTQIFFWLFSLPMAIEAFYLKNPYYAVIGTLLIGAFIILCPFINKIFLKLKIDFTFKQKLCMFLISFFINALLIRETEKSWGIAIICICLMIISWIGVIIYSKTKSRNRKV